MEFRVDRDVLSQAVTWAARSLPQRPPVPVLAGLRLEAEAGGTVALAGFDFEVSAEVRIPADVTEAGTVLVSGRLLADISKSLPAQTVTITEQNRVVSIRCGAAHFSLPLMSVDEYPSLPQMPATSGVLPGETFAQAVSQVGIAASRDETLPILTAVRVEIHGNTLTLMATDRYRLAMRELLWNPQAEDLEATALVRAKTLGEAAKSMGAESVSLALSGTDGAGAATGHDLIGFEAGGRKTTSLLVDGDYPPVRSLFPAETPITAVVDTQALVEAVRRVALVAERNTPVRLSFTDDKLVLDASSQADGAQASEELPASVQGGGIVTAFNPQFLLEGLGQLDAPFVRLSFTVPQKPAVLTGQQETDGEDDPSYRYLLMPIRLSPDAAARPVA